MRRNWEGLRKRGCKRAADPKWKPRGKGRNAAIWAEVKSLMESHPTMNADQIAKLADCGVATVYRIKKEVTHINRKAALQTCRTASD